MIVEQQVSPDITAVLTLVAEPSRSSHAQESLKKAVSRAQEALVKFDPQDPGIRGCLADIIMENLLREGWKDSFLDLGGVFIARGRDFNGPWKIPVVDKTTAHARRAFFYKASNVSAATVEKNQAGSEIKSVTVFLEGEACDAQRLASAASETDLGKAKKILKTGGAVRYVLIDQSGNFLQNP